MKKIILLILLFVILPVNIFSQMEYVESSNRIYSFLERMENSGIIPEYNSFEIPKTRIQIAEYLRSILKSYDKLTSTDRRMLDDFIVEFEFDLDDTLNRSSRLIGEGDYNFFSNNQKYLYYKNEEDFNLFINLTAGLDYIHSYKKDVFNNNALAGDIGGIIRGTIGDRFGYYIKGTNGIVQGNRSAALIKRNIAQNFKFTEKPDESFYDETEGHLSADFRFIRFKLGRDFVKLGYGDIPVVNHNSPMFDYIGMNINYEFFNYSFLHAELLNSEMINGFTNYSEKYMVYHRLGFNLSRHFDFGAGEYIIYGKRGIDLSYLNPFVFYKSIEHANRDRDNSMLFFDFNNNTIPHTKIHFMLLIDDITYSKIGTGWYGNQVMINTGFTTSNILNYPVDLSGNYRRTEPFTFSHRIPHNNFTNLEVPLGTYNIPNSELFNINVEYRPNYRLVISSGLVYIIHGQNPGTPDNIRNIGGDIYIGHRDGDPEEVNFLDGNLEHLRTYHLSVKYEPLNDICFSVYLAYLNNMMPTEKSQKEIQSFFTLTTIF